MPSAREHAASILTRVEREQGFAAAVLEAQTKKVSDTREAAMVTELVLGVLRRRSWLDKLIDDASHRGTAKLDPETRNLLRIAAYQIAFLDRVPPRAATNEAVKAVREQKGKGLAGFANALLRNLATKDKAILRPPHSLSENNMDLTAAACSLPKWLLADVIQERGFSHAMEISRAFNSPSRRTMRVNTRSVSPEDILEQLGDAATAGRHLPWFIQVEQRSVARELEEQGQAAYQDEGAGMVALALEPAKGDRILDACAGRGGKTGALACLADDLSITAADRKRAKLERLLFEMDRLGVAVEAVSSDLVRGVKGLDNSFDRVLLDAPCSGTGTIGRRPEIRWRLGKDDVAALKKIQASMLDNLKTLIRPGGRLVFAVCSILKAEGENQRQAFLEKNPEFAPVEIPPKNWPKDIPWNHGSVFIDPGKTGTDGYYLFAVRRAESN